MQGVSLIFAQNRLIFLASFGLTSRQKLHSPLRAPLHGIALRTTFIFALWLLVKSLVYLKSLLHFLKLRLQLSNFLFQSLDLNEFGFLNQLRFAFHGLFLSFVWNRRKEL